MKKLILIFFLSFNLLNAGIVISPDSLPVDIKKFIQEHFPNATIGLIEQDSHSYEIYLSDGSELEFFLNGKLKEAENHRALNISILPIPVQNIIKNTHPNASVIEVERKISHYKIKLNNEIKLYIDDNGIILRQKYDD
ncbi:PepSY-like domain-containing protein [Campylobacter volucris]|uniref:PepSY-like domain-containing protein n=1 Tax=Campylobacter volucris TaxID=1031542 RepID=UPI00189E7E1B|nr:PepSY-like domain-containing protein [Campylobacter volucris]MBF7046243.1 PepSY-like domain-containing protein [Campylobacter volucris]